MKTLNGSKSRLLTGIAVLFAIISLSVSCTKSSDSTYGTGGNTGGTGDKGGPGTNEVWIQGMAFNPGSITVAANDTITWTNKDGIAHTVTSTKGLFDSGSIGNGRTYTHIFSTAGTYTYKCTFHPNMTGTVTVN